MEEGVGEVKSGFVGEGRCGFGVSGLEKQLWAIDGERCVDRS